MKKVVLVVALIATGMKLNSCTEEARAKKFGGEFDLKLQPNEELINITWKNDDMWYLVKDKKTGAFTFKEHSSYGIWEGKVNIK